MRNSRETRFDAAPSTEGGILAFTCSQEKGADVDPLLRKAGLSRTQIEVREGREIYAILVSWRSVTVESASD
jgi:hypothetical protein